MLKFQMVLLGFSMVYRLGLCVLNNFGIFLIDINEVIGSKLHEHAIDRRIGAMVD